MTVETETPIEAEAARLAHEKIAAAKRAAGAAKRVEAQAAAVERREGAAAEARRRQSESLRETLRKAIAARADADAEVEQAQAIMARAEQVVRTAQREVESFSGLAAAIARAHADAIAASVLEGIDAPNLELPADIKKNKREAREAQASLDEAREKLEEVRTARPVLADGMRAAERRAYEAGIAVQRGVAAVVADVAELLAEEVMAEQIAIWQRQDQISGFLKAARPQTGRITPEASPRLAELVPQLASRQNFVAASDPQAAAAARWPWTQNAFHDQAERYWNNLIRRLASDADATFCE